MTPFTLTLGLTLSAFRSPRSPVDYSEPSPVNQESTTFHLQKTGLHAFKDAFATQCVFVCPTSEHHHCRRAASRGPPQSHRVGARASKNYHL